MTDPCARAVMVLPDDAVEVGRIEGPWGVRGEVRVGAYAADAQALPHARHWRLVGADGAGHGVAVAALRRQGGVWVARLEGITDRDAALALRGMRVFVSRADFPAPAAGEHYWVDLIGCAVVNRDGVPLGHVVDLLDTGVHAVLCVQAESGGTAPPPRLIPFVEAYVERVDLAARRIDVDWGLDY